MSFVTGDFDWTDEAPVFHPACPRSLNAYIESVCGTHSSKSPPDHPYSVFLATTIKALRAQSAAGCEASADLINQIEALDNPHLTES